MSERWKSRESATSVFCISVCVCSAAGSAHLYRTALFCTSLQVQIPSVFHQNGKFFGVIPDGLLTDPSFHVDFTTTNDYGKTFSRGGMNYIRPCGWYRLALAVVGKYPSDAWIGPLNGVRQVGEEAEYPGEWAVCYHGTDIRAALRIATGGFDNSKCTRARFGPGAYTSPDPTVAEAYADQRTPFRFQGRSYKVMVQSRVHVNAIMQVSLSCSASSAQLPVERSVAADTGGWT